MFIPDITLWGGGLDLQQYCYSVSFVTVKFKFLKVYLIIAGKISDAQ